MERRLPGEGLVIWVCIASQQKFHHVTVVIIDRTKEASLKLSLVIDPIHICPQVHETQYFLFYFT
jgi:hypothetical protein